jgi:hypothetical protein
MTVVTRRVTARALVCAVVTSTVSCLQPTEKPVESGRGFITTVYTDTEVESFSRTTEHLRGVISSRRDSLFYVVWLGDSGLVRSVDLIARGHGRGGASVHAGHYPMAKGTLPMVYGSGALLEQLLRRARALGGDSISVPVMFVGANATTDVVTITSNGPDSLIVVGQDGGSIKNSLHLAIDSLWHVTGMKLPLSGEVMEPTD